MRLLNSSTGLFVFLLPGLALAQVVEIPACGELNQRACTSSDGEFSANNDLGTTMSCDFGLTTQTVSGQSLCVNGSSTYTSGFLGQLSFPARATLPVNTTWTGWAMAQQRYGIGGDAPMNYVTTIGTHNSFSNYNQGFLASISADQRYSITDQLNLGARYIRIDGYFWINEMRICHGNASECSNTFAALSPDSSGRLFANAVKEVADWLNANPTEFIVLDLNGDPAGYDYLVMEPIKQLIGASKIVTQTDAQCPGLVGPGGYAYNCYFPSLNWAAAHGKQLVILANNYNEYSSVLYQSFLFPRDVLLDEKDPFGSSPDFSTCRDNNNLSVGTHAVNLWTYTSEDRTGSVIVVARSSFIGFLDEPEVTTATTCGYSLIAIDFLNSRSLTVSDPYAGADGWPSEVTTDADLRFQNSVWSFDVNDFGAFGNAYMKSNGRWSTLSAGDNLKYACSTVNGFAPNARYVVSNTSGPFFDSHGNLAGIAACQAQGLYFSHPYTAPQNNALAIAANGQSVWLNYVASASNVTFNTAPAGLSITIDGNVYTAPLTLPLTQGEHQIGVPAQTAGTPGSRYAFQNWSDGSTSAGRFFTVSGATSLTANYIAQYQVSLAANPSSGGTVAVTNPSSDGYYNSGSPLTITATPSGGFTFGAFSGTQPGASNPLTFALTGPVTETADFSTAAGLFLSVNTDGTRTNRGGEESVPLAVTNNTTSGVGAVVVTSITGIQVLSGTGNVTLKTATPISIGDMAPNSTSSPFPLLFEWPSTAARVRFTVNFSANSGLYRGSTTLTVTQ